MTPVQAMVHLSGATENMCPGFENAVRSASRNGQFMLATARGAQLECTMILGQGSRGAYFGLSLTPIGSQLDVQGTLRSIISRHIGAPVSGDHSASDATAAMSRGAGQSELLAILDKVPQAARPVAFVGRGTYRSGLGGLPYYVVEPWAVFPNGMAVSGECSDWSPLNGAPTHSIDSRDCDVERWRKMPEGYVFIDDDGDVSDPQNVLATAFKRGELPGISVESSTTASVGVATGYTVGSTHSWTGELTLAADGRFRGAASTAFSASGAGIVAHSGGDRPGIDGTYAVDGFLIAIRNAQGQVVVKPIAKSVEDGETYLYYEGALYWPPE